MVEKKFIIRFSDFILINTPAFLLIIASSITVSLIRVFNNVPFYVFLIVAWWFLCAAFMLLRDYKKKRYKFRRLLNIQSQDGLNYPRKLRSTICGLFIILALKNRIRTI